MQPGSLSSLPEQESASWVKAMAHFPGISQTREGTAGFRLPTAWPGGTGLGGDGWPLTRCHLFTQQRAVSDDLSVPGTTVGPGVVGENRTPISTLLEQTSTVAKGLRVPFLDGLAFSFA